MDLDAKDKLGQMLGQLGLTESSVAELIEVLQTKEFAAPANSSDQEAEWDEIPGEADDRVDGVNGDSGVAVLGQESAPVYKVQVKFDAKTRRDIETIKRYFAISSAELLRQAWRTYFTFRKQIAWGREVGAWDPTTEKFYGFDIPFATPSLRLHDRKENRSGGHIGTQTTGS